MKRNIRVQIKNTETNEIQTDVWWDWDWNSFWWETGNAACDCNRRDFFYQAKGIKLDEESECSDHKYIVRINDFDTGEMLYNEMKSDTELLSDALKAICLTRDYVGEEKLPPIDGWDWYDAGKAISERIPDDEWSDQFRIRCEDYEYDNSINYLDTRYTGTSSIPLGINDPKDIERYFTNLSSDWMCDSNDIYFSISEFIRSNEDVRDSLNDK